MPVFNYASELNVIETPLIQQDEQKERKRETKEAKEARKMTRKSIAEE
jgi:hypothetical protein